MKTILPRYRAIISQCQQSSVQSIGLRASSTFDRHNWTSTLSSVKPEYLSSASENGFEATMAKGKKFNKGAGSGTERKAPNRPTHFLCFPLARDDTVPEFAKSMQYFRDVSTEPQRKPPGYQRTSVESGVQVKEHAEQAVEGRSTNGLSDHLGHMSKPVDSQVSFADSLKILPSIVHRGPGTLHLTLGVMNLSDPAEMQKATDLLQTLDLKQMLLDAAKGPTADMKKARKWNDKAIGAPDAGSSQENEEPGQFDSSEKAEPAGIIKSLTKSISPPSTHSPTPPTFTPDRLHISLTGLSTFPSPKKARVIWAKPRAQAYPPDTPTPSFPAAEQDRLYNFALHLHHTFKKAGLITETRDPVLHATLANMRYKTQAKGGRTTKGANWRLGKKRWEDGLVDMRALAKVFNMYRGDVDVAGKDEGQEHEGCRGVGEAEGDSERESDAEEDGKVKQDDGDVRQHEDPEKEFVWGADIEIDRVAICKMGSTKRADFWEEWYPAVSEKMIFPD